MSALGQAAFRGDSAAPRKNRRRGGIACEQTGLLERNFERGGRRIRTEHIGYRVFTVWKSLVQDRIEASTRVPIEISEQRANREPGADEANEHSSDYQILNQAKDEEQCRKKSAIERRK